MVLVAPLTGHIAAKHKDIRILPMLYRILALVALFFFTACAGDGPHTLESPRKTVNQEYGTFTAPPSYEEFTQVTQAPPTPAVQVVKVGLLVPLSGQASAVGMALQDAATLALMDKYTYAGGNDSAVKVVLVPKDTQGTPAGAAAAAREALNAGAKLLVGPLFSGNVSVVASLARQKGVNVLTFSNNPDVAGENVFVFGFQAEQQVRRVLNYALNRSLAQIALLAPNNAYGGLVKQYADATLQASQAALVTEQFYSPVASPEPQLDALASIHAQTPLQAVLLPEGGQKLTSLVQGLQARGIRQPDIRFLGTGLWDEPAVLKSGLLTGGWFASSPPERFEAFAQRFGQFFGYAPPRLSALAYDALALAASLAMREEGADFSAAVLTDPIGYNGPVNGIFRCGENGICERGLAVLEVMADGSAKVIDRAPEHFNRH